MPNLIDADSIIIPENRQRRQFDPAKLQELITSIEKLGLLQPPVLRQSDNIFTLVAGERRLRAMKEIWELGGSFHYQGLRTPHNQVPYTLLSDLGPLAAREAELDENIRREDLTWQERGAAEAALLSLRQDQAVAHGFTPIPTHTDLAEELGMAKGTANSIRKRILLSDHLHIPEVAKAATAEEAFKILKRREERQRNAALAEALGGEVTSSRHELHNVNCIPWLRTQHAATFDIILTDPPYGMGADEFGDSGGMSSGAHFYNDSPENFQSLMADLLPELTRVAKPESHLYLFCDIDWFGHLKDALKALGWNVFRTPLIWYKPSGFRAPWPEHGPQRKYETILYARRGDLRTLILAGDVIDCAPDSNLGHNAQKPVELYHNLLRRSARAGMRVLDPFCGTGPIFPAAQRLSVAAIGCELDPAAYGIAATRLKDLE